MNALDQLEHIKSLGTEIFEVELKSFLKSWGLPFDEQATYRAMVNRKVMWQFSMWRAGRTNAQESASQPCG